MNLTPINQTSLFSLDNYLLDFIKLSDKNKRKYQIIDSNLDIKLNEKYILKKIEKLIK